MRSDMSRMVVHLTRNRGEVSAADALFSIFRSRSLRGGAVTLKPRKFEVVCFSEAPIDSLARVVATAKESRYAPLGVLVSKRWLFEQGGRTAIYGPKEEVKRLPDEIAWRAVPSPYPGHAKDYSDEREWRIQVDRLPLDAKTTTLIVPTGDWYHALVEAHAERDQRASRLIGVNPLTRISDFSWKILALDALGIDVAVEWRRPPPFSFAAE